MYKVKLHQQSICLSLSAHLRAPSDILENSSSLTESKSVFLFTFQSRARVFLCSVERSSLHRGTWPSPALWKVTDLFFSVFRPSRTSIVSWLTFSSSSVLMSMCLWVNLGYISHQEKCRNIILSQLKHWFQFMHYKKKDVFLRGEFVNYVTEKLASNIVDSFTILTHYFNCRPCLANQILFHWSGKP